MVKQVTSYSENETSVLYFSLYDVLMVNAFV